MSNARLKVAFILTFMLSMALVASSIAIDYNPGVSAGQWVKYGNFVVIGSTGVPSSYNDTDWMKMEVVAVIGKNVSIRMFGKYKNGTDTEETNQMCNVETGEINGTGTGILPVIAANLNEGDVLPSPSPYPITINKTITRTYAGITRTVNILNLTTTVPYNMSFAMTWDKASGVLMEVKMKVSIGTPTPTNEEASFSAVDTNIFATGIVGLLIENMIYIVAAVIVLIIIVAAVVLVRGRKPPPTAPTTPETPETPPPSETLNMS